MDGRKLTAIGNHRQKRNMKTQKLTARYFLTPSLLMWSILTSFAASDAITRDFPFALNYELGKTLFAPGDSITIRELRGTSETITPEGTYWVEGTYTLASKDEANLAFFATTKSSAPSPIDARQTAVIKKGTGSFELIKKMNGDGFLHLSFYPIPSGSDFGGIYFGQGDWVLRQTGVSHGTGTNP